MADCGGRQEAGSAPPGSDCPASADRRNSLAAVQQHRKGRLGASGYFFAGGASTESSTASVQVMSTLSPTFTLASAFLSSTFEL